MSDHELLSEKWPPALPAATARRASLAINSMPPHTRAMCRRMYNRVSYRASEKTYKGVLKLPMIHEVLVVQWQIATDFNKATVP